MLAQDTCLSTALTQIKTLRTKARITVGRLRTQGRPPGWAAVPGGGMQSGEVPAAGPHVPSRIVWEPALGDEFESSSF